MRAKIGKKVSVVCYYSARKNVFLPHMIQWQNKEYVVGEVGMIHKYKIGDVYHHIYELVDKEQSMAFRLNFDTAQLCWTLEVVSDGLPS